MKTTTVYRDSAYPMIEQYMEKNHAKYERNVKQFIKDRIEDLNDIAPYKRIHHHESERQQFWKDLGLKEKDFKGYISRTYYGHKNIKPLAAKDPFTICLMQIIRYYYLKGKKKELELAMLHLSFSGKFYPSKHYNSFRIEPYKHVMEYVVNNKLSYKFDIKKQGSVMKTMIVLNDSWIKAYEKRLKDWMDDDVVYMIDQLIDRIKSSLRKIANVYYKAHKSEEYMTYSSDNMDEDDYRLADSNSLKIERYVTATMNYFTTTQVNYTICKISANGAVKVNDVKNLFDIIINNSENVELLRELVTIIVSEFFVDNPLGKVESAEFIVYGIKPRPNTSNKQIVRMKEIQQKLLEQSDDYLKRQRRGPTKAAYIKALQSYVVYTINKVAVHK